MRAKIPTILFAAMAALSLPAAEINVRHDTAARKVVVNIDGGPFTEFRYNEFAKPVLYPVLGPGGVPMVRNWPMGEAAAGEDKDHVHQKSIWFTHGAVNGVDFWAEGAKAGKITTDKITRAAVENGAGVIESNNRWVAPDGKVVCTDTTLVRCGEQAGARFIDFTITIHATNGPVTFGDTKEGTMGIRTRPELQINPEKNKAAAGTALNSEGQKGKDIWGQKARWVDYHAPISGKVLGVAVFDHPSNLRHPTTWHAREYGLIAANPFGLHDFSNGKLPEKAGDFTIDAGSSRAFRYRFLFHEGDAAAAAIERRWNAWAKE